MNLAKLGDALACPAMRMAVAFAATGFLAISASAQGLQSQLAGAKQRLHSRLGVGGAKKKVAANGMTITTGVSASALANTLAGSGITISGTPTFQGAAAQAGTFTGAPGIVGFSSGIILSSGAAADAAYGYAGEDEPDTSEGKAGYAPLSALINNDTTYDAAVLQFSFIPTTSTIYFRYIFASAEYPNYVGEYNDPMALFVNGTNAGNNVAILPTVPPIAVTINNVNASAHSQYFNKYNGPGDALPYGGETRVLTATAAVSAGQVNTITLAVADALDHSLDSAVFIEASSLSTTPPAPSATAPALSPAALTILGLGLLASGALLVRRARSGVAR